MKQTFLHPTIDPEFKSQLREQVVAEFETQLRPTLLQWRWWLPVSVSFAAIALFVVISGGAEQVYTKVELTNIERELTLIEQELTSDMSIEEAIEFTNL